MYLEIKKFSVIFFKWNNIINFLFILLYRNLLKHSILLDFINYLKNVDIYSSFEKNNIICSIELYYASRKN